MTQLVFPTFRLDLGADLLRTSGGDVRLRRKSWQVLLHLVHQAGRVVTKEELLDAVWSDVAVGDDMPRICVGEIRRALGDSARSPQVIETVHGRGYRFLLQPEPPEGAEPPRLVLLPIEPDEPDDATRTFATALETELRSRLAERGSLVVVGGESTILARMRSAEPLAVLDALGADAVLRVGLESRRDGTDLRVELLGMDPPRQSERRLEGDPEDVGQLCDEIVDDVTGTLRRTSTPPPRPLRGPVASTRAHHLYLRGLRLQNLYGTDDWERAALLFEEAIAVDPGYALPWAGLASIHVLRASLGLGDHGPLIAAAEEAARRALSIDPDLAEAHCRMGSIAMLGRWDFEEAERRLRTATALRPSDSIAHFTMQRLFSCLCRHDEARRAGRRAFELDPLSPAMVAHRGFADLAARRPEVALALFDEALEDEPRNGLARAGRMQALRNLERFDEALAVADELGNVLGGFLIPTLKAHLLAVAGHRQAARRELERLERGDAPVPFTQRAVLHAALGDVDGGFRLLDHALERREPHLVDLMDATFDSLRPDPRFADLVEAVGLPARVVTAPGERSDEPARERSAPSRPPRRATTRG